MFGSPDDFLKFLRESMTQKAQDFEKLGPLSISDAEEWQSIEKENAKLENEITNLKARQEIISARRKLFWCKIEQDTGIYDKNMRIVGTDLFIEKDKPVESSTELQDSDNT